MKLVPFLQLLLLANCHTQIVIGSYQGAICLRPNGILPHSNWGYSVVWRESSVGPEGHRYRCLELEGQFSVFPHIALAVPASYAKTPAHRTVDTACVIC